VPCREHLAQLRGRQGDFDRLGARIAAVTFEPPERVARFLTTTRLPFPVLCDPERRAYTAFGLGRAPKRRIWNLPTLWAYARGLVTGTPPHLPHGDLAQLGGDVVLDREGAVVYTYRSRYPADRPRVEELLAVVARAAASSPSRWRKNEG
jgi:hypothetical protein